MRMTQGWTGLRTAVIALGLFACAQTGVKAAAISAPVPMRSSVTAPPDRSIRQRQRTESPARM